MNQLIPYSANGIIATRSLAAPPIPKDAIASNRLMIPAAVTAPIYTNGLLLKNFSQNVRIISVMAIGYRKFKIGNDMEIKADKPTLATHVLKIASKHTIFL